MDQVYLDNVVSTNSNKMWVNISMRGRSLHTWRLNIYSSAVHSLEKDNTQNISPASTGKQEK